MWDNQKLTDGGWMNESVSQLSERWMYVINLGAFIYLFGCYLIYLFIFYLVAHFEMKV